MSAARKRGLGRGFGEIISSHASEQGSISELKIGALKPGPFQPRQDMDPKSLGEMARTIAERGILQPILVRPIKSGHEIIAGERRWRAAKLAGLRSVPVVVRELSDRDALLAALVENIQRRDLNALEQATAARRVVKEIGLSITDAARSLGMTRPALSNLLRLLELETSILKMLADSSISAGHARALLALPAATRLKVAKEIVARDLTVRDVEGRAQKAARARPKTSHDTASLCAELSGKLGMRVSITGAGKAGKLTISYRSLDSLDALVKLLRKFK